MGVGVVEAGDRYDLSVLTRKLKHKGKYKKVCGLIDRMRSIGSCLADIRVARSAIQLLINEFVDVPEEETRQRDSDALLGGGLFTQAVIFYARATDTSSNSRRPSGISGKLPEDLVLMHKEVMALRNDAMAHFGDAGDGWSSDATVMIIEPEHFSLRTPSFRTNYRGDFSKRFLVLLDSAAELAGEIERERTSELNKELLSLAGDAEFIATLETCHFVPGTFFRTDDGADRFERETSGSSASTANWTNTTRPSSQRKAPPPTNAR